MGGKEKQQSSGTTVVNSTQTPTPTAEETALNQLQLGQAQAFDPYQRQLNAAGGDLVLNLLKGVGLPGYLNQLPGGISQEVAGNISRQSIQDIMPSFQKSGILDSGTAAQIASRTSADVYNQAQQFNLQNLMQLLNLAVGGQAQVQQPAIQTASMLGNQLAGLRSNSSTGSTSTSGTTLGMNPFTKALQQSIGTNLGANFNGPNWLSAYKGG